MLTDIAYLLMFVNYHSQEIGIALHRLADWALIKVVTRG